MTCECWWGSDRRAEYVGRCIARWADVVAAEACCIRGAAEIEDACIWSNSASRRWLDDFDFCEGRLLCCCCRSGGESGSLELLETIYFSWPSGWKGFDIETRLVVILEVEGSVIGRYLEVGVKYGWLRMFWLEYYRMSSSKVMCISESWNLLLVSLLRARQHVQLRLDALAQPVGIALSSQVPPVERFLLVWNIGPSTAVTPV